MKENFDVREWLSDGKSEPYRVLGYGINDYGIEYGIEVDEDGVNHYYVCDNNDRVECESERDAIAQCMDVMREWAQEYNEENISEQMQNILDVLSLD